MDDSDANLKEEVEKSISFSSTLTMIDKADSKKVSGRKLPSSRSKSHVPASAKKKKTVSKLKMRQKSGKKSIVKKESEDVDMGGVKKLPRGR